MTKVCSVCNKRKDISKFCSTGRWCKSCKSIYDKNWYLINKEESNNKAKRYSRTKKGRESVRKASLKYGAKNGNRAAVSKRHYDRVKANPEKYQEFLRMMGVHSNVYYALKIGKLRKGVCEMCGNPKVEAHHDDYDKPLEVRRWLCRLCHSILRRTEEAA